MKNDEILKPGGNEGTGFADEQTDKRIHEILSDENDGITEEDIANVKTNVDNTDEAQVVSEIPEPDKALLKESDDEDPEDKIIKDDSDPEIDNTSWNILES